MTANGKNRVWFVVLVMATLLAAGRASAAVPEEVWRAAEKDYFEGRPGAAVERYFSLLQAQGLDNASLRYNLGTAFLAQGKWGEAVYHLERAKRLGPDSMLLEHIEKNLELAKVSARASKAKEIEMGLVSFDESHGLPFAVFTILPRSLVLWLFSAVFGCTCLALFLLGLRRTAALHHALRLVLISLLLPLLVFGSLAAGRIWADGWVKLGIVTSVESRAHEGPTPASPFVLLPEGLEIRLESGPKKNYGFWKVVMPSGRVAYAPAETIRAL